MKTVRRPPYPKWNPGYFPCSSLTPLPLSSRRPSVSFGGFGIRHVFTSRVLGFASRSCKLSARWRVSYARREALSMQPGVIPGHGVRWLDTSVVGASGRTPLRRGPYATHDLVTPTYWRVAAPTTRNACAPNTRTSSGGGSRRPSSRSRVAPHSSSPLLTQRQPSVKGPTSPVGRHM